MKRLLISLLSLTVLLTTRETYSKKNSSTFQLPEPTSTLININNLAMWIREDGLAGLPPTVDSLELGVKITKSDGIVFPRGTARIVSQDGFLWGGLVQDGQAPELRVGGHTRISGLTPGRILERGIPENPDDSPNHIWRIRPDWRNADLRQDTAELLRKSPEEVTLEEINAVRQQYEQDWNTWPWQKGAPFYDNNGNGIMDPGEEPGLANADQVIWFVANNLDPQKTPSLYGSPPIGLEYQVTLWGYDRNDAFANMIFKRYRLIYKGTATTPDTAHIDSMFVTQWSDADIGEADNDYGRVRYAFRFDVCL